MRISQEIVTVKRLRLEKKEEDKSKMYAVSHGSGGHQLHDSADEKNATLKISTGTQTRRLSVLPSSFRYRDLVAEALRRLKSRASAGARL